MGRLFDSGIVDLQGRPVRDREIKGSALIKATQWVDFLQDWGERLKLDEPWVHLLLHATINFHQSFAIIARRLRKNEYWTGGMTMEEQTVGLVHDAEVRLNWFLKQSENVDPTLLPEWAKFMFASLEGGFRMQVRIAREAEMILKRGHLLVNVNPHVKTVRDARELGNEEEG